MTDKKTQSLFHINQDYMELMNTIEDAEGEISEEMQEALTINEMELKDKSSAYVAVLKYKGNQRNFIKEEIKRLQAIDKRLLNTETRLKDSIKNAMNLYGIEKIELPFNTISFRKSTSLQIDADINDLPDKLKIISVDVISKTEIKKMINAGEKFEGIQLIENKNLQIK